MNRSQRIRVCLLLARGSTCGLMAFAVLLSPASVQGSACARPWMHTVHSAPLATVPIRPTVPVRAIHLPLLYRENQEFLNGGFESGSLAPGWQALGGLGCHVVSEEAYSGRYAALLGNPAYDNAGGCPTGEATIHQIVDVPTKGRPCLRFWYQIHSYDTLDYDYLLVEVSPWPEGPSETVWLDGRIVWNREPWSSGWRQAVIPLDHYRGRAIRVSFRNVMTNKDGWYNTWTYVDDIARERKVRTQANTRPWSGSVGLSYGEANVDDVPVLHDIVLTL